MNNRSDSNERKNIKTISDISRTLVLTLVCRYGARVPTLSKAADPVKDGPKLVELSKVKTVGGIESFKPADTFAMACAKCQTIMVKQVIANVKEAYALEHHKPAARSNE